MEFQLNGRKCLCETEMLVNRTEKSITAFMLQEVKPELMIDGDSVILIIKGTLSAKME